MTEIYIRTIIDMLAQLIGIEGAEKIMEAVIAEAKLPAKTFYSDSEFSSICDRLAARGGSFKTFAALARTSEYREKQYQNIIDREKNEKAELARLYRQMQDDADKMKAMNEELVRREKLSVVGQLAASIAHELRNPLTGVKNISFYLNKYLNTSDPKISEFLTLLAADVERMNIIITDLLDFSKAKTIEKTTRFSFVLLEECIALVCGKHGSITVKRGFAYGMHDVMIDLEQMKRVLVHLLSNACDAVNNTGTITITTSRLNDDAGETNFAALSVEDNGHGMDSETLSHLFEPLFSTKPKGIGLGLPIIRDIIESHGGRVTVESQPGKGARFTVILPITPATR